MVNINNPSATPDSFINGNPKIITIDWTARIKEGDNKVDIYFSIEDNCPVFFIDQNGENKKEVYIGAYDFEKSDKPYSGATYMVVTESQALETAAIITVTAIDKNGNGQTDSDVCTITYK